MKLFFNTRAMRSTSLIVLLVWLSALASGVANACLLETRQTHSHIATPAFIQAATLALVAAPGHAGAVVDGVDESHSDAPCLKVCDESMRAVPKQQATATQSDAGPAPVVQVVWGELILVGSTLLLLDEPQSASPGLPIRIRFSRLAT